MLLKHLISLVYLMFMFSLLCLILPTTSIETTRVIGYEDLKKFTEQVFHGDHPQVMIKRALKSRYDSDYVFAKPQGFNIGFHEVFDWIKRKFILLFYQFLDYLEKIYRFFSWLGELT